LAEGALQPMRAVVTASPRRISKRSHIGCSATGAVAAAIGGRAAGLTKGAPPQLIPVAAAAWLLPAA
jgi:hypothetical protein